MTMFISTYVYSAIILVFVSPFAMKLSVV